MLTYSKSSSARMKALHADPEFKAGSKQMPNKITVNLLVPGQQFGADFYIRAVIEVESFGTAETGRGYLADPEGYDAGSGPEWFVAEDPELFLDCGGDGEQQGVRAELASALVDFITSDATMIEQVESAIADMREEDA